MGPSEVVEDHSALANDQPVDSEDDPNDAGALPADPDGADVDGQDAQVDVLLGEEEAGEALQCPPCPGSPLDVERLAHELVHWLYRPWCEWCVRGRAAGPNAKKVPAAHRESKAPKALL